MIWEADEYVAIVLCEVNEIAGSKSARGGSNFLGKMVVLVKQ